MSISIREQKILTRLNSLPFLKRVPQEDLRVAASMWSLVRLKEGRALWREDDWVDALAIVLDGELEINRKGVKMGSVRRGELIGEASAFFVATRRSATVSACESTTLIRLSTQGLQRLRKRGNGLYGALLDASLQTLARRVRATTLKVAQLARGSMDMPSFDEPSGLVGWWRRLTSKETNAPCPALEPVLRKLNALHELEPDVMKALCSGFAPLHFDAGKAICAQGMPYDGVYVIGDGTVDVLREVSRGRVEQLTVLSEGDQFGMNALIESSSRTASCVAATPVWVFQMSPEAYKKLEGEARLAWGENMLTDLATQIRNVNSLLHRVSTTPQTEGVSKAPPTGDLRALLQHSGYEGASDEALSELDNIRLVKTEVRKRAPANHGMG